MALVYQVVYSSTRAIYFPQTDTVPSASTKSTGKDGDEQQEDGEAIPQRYELQAPSGVQKHSAQGYLVSCEWLGFISCLERAKPANSMKGRGMSKCYLRVFADTMRNAVFLAYEAVLERSLPVLRLCVSAKVGMEFRWPLTGRLLDCAFCRVCWIPGSECSFVLGYLRLLTA